MRGSSGDQAGAYSENGRALPSALRVAT